MLVKQIRVDSIGNSSYLVDSEEAKVCGVIDPLRDVDMYTGEAESPGVQILYALETHVHNDFVSGSRELAARAGATVGSSAAGGPLFEHRPLRKGDSIDLGEVRIDVIETPGHTPEHISFLATDTSRGHGPHALFSGGALLVGGAARSDLLGKQLAPLNDEVVVYPTHGGGSFCLATVSDTNKTTSTIGEERQTNPFPQASTEADFLDLAMGDLPPVPSYYKRMVNINRRGPRVLGSVPVLYAGPLYPLSPREAWVRDYEDQVAIDARSVDVYTSVHIPGSYSIPMGNTFGTWIGWLVEPEKPLVFLTDDLSTTDEMARQMIRIGYDSLEGYVDGGMRAWQ